eukprot:1148777-Pelagomonas_calceolata.AAC.2
MPDIKGAYISGDRTQHKHQSPCNHFSTNSNCTPCSCTLLCNLLRDISAVSGFLQGEGVSLGSNARGQNTSHNVTGKKMKDHTNQNKPAHAVLVQAILLAPVAELYCKLLQPCSCCGLNSKLDKRNKKMGFRAQTS